MSEPAPRSVPVDLAAPMVEGCAFAEHGWLITLEGDCDLTVAARVRGLLERGTAEGHRHLVIDISEATLIDCAVLGALVGSVRTLARDPWSAVALVIGDRDIPRRLAAQLGLDALFDVLPSRQAAMDLVTEESHPRREGWRGVLPGRIELRATVA
jgi:anti-anti-sigma regulatory factor